MTSSSNNSGLVAFGAVALGALGLLLIKQNQKPKEKPLIALIGDVGGTNVRLTLRKMDTNNRTSSEIKPLTKYESQKYPSFLAAVQEFLQEYKGTQNWPTVGCIGIAGAVENNTVLTTNVEHWPVTDGNAIAEELNMKSFTLINDFAANGYGICLLKLSDAIKLDQNHIDEDAVKVVTGPGTGLGCGFLAKPQHGEYHDIHSSEGGHTDFAVVTEEDWELRKFAIEYIRTSKNVENHSYGKEIKRVCVERLCAGPAVPLLYEFYKTQDQFKDLPRPLEADGKTTDELTSKDIIKRGMDYENNGDELCFKVIEKFCEIMAVEVGNVALQYLPYGGIYLVGGVTQGIMQYLEVGQTNERFLNAVYEKGRLSQTVRKIPLFVVKPEVELGILGAEECAFRVLEQLQKHSK